MLFSTSNWGDCGAARLLLRGLLSLAVFGLMIAVGCGRRSNDSDASNGGESLSADLLRQPPDTVFVAPGSLDVVITPDSSSDKAPKLVQLFSEPGAEIFYTLLGEDSLDEGMPYEKPILMLPPFEIFAQARKDGQSGPVRSARFGGEEAAHAWISRLGNRSIAYPPTQNLRALKLEVEGEQRLQSKDPKLDVPAFADFMDLEEFSATRIDDRLHLRLRVRGKLSHQARVGYGFELGPSGIALNDFGSGAQYKWRIDCSVKKCRLGEQANEDVIGEIEPEIVEDGREMRVTLNADQTTTVWTEHLAVRSYAIDARKATSVVDRTLPIYVNSPFKLFRSDLSGMASDAAQLAMLVAPEQVSDELLTAYADATATLPALIERINHYPLLGQGTTPLFVIPHAQSKFTGINSSDRGVFSALGEDASRLALVQLLAHEFGHFQNSGWSQIENRWIQEGFSEWTAERAMYQMLPARAVYRFLRQLRVEPFLRLVQKGEGDSPLNEWNSLETNYGYEKVFVFFQLLDREVGSEVLGRVQLLARNQKLNTDQFQSALEKFSGKDLDALFAFWVRPGVLDERYDPAKLLVDQDQDGLLAIDEDGYGLSDLRIDSNGDGIQDPEEVFGSQNASLSISMNPKPASNASGIQLFNSAPREANDFVRIQRTDSEGPALKVSFHQALSESADHKHSSRRWLLRTPSSLSATNGQETSQFVLPALVPGADGNLRPWQPAAAPEELGLLPVPVRTTAAEHGANWQLVTDPKMVQSLQDAVFDVPSMYDGLDISAIDMQITASHLELTIRTRGGIDLFGADGGFVLDFSELRVQPRTLPEQVDGLTIKSDGNLIVTYRQSQILDSGKSAGIRVDFVAKDRAKFSIPKLALGNMLSASTHSSVCVSSEIELESRQLLRDRAGCIPLAWGGFDLWRLQMPSVAGEATHTVDLMLGKGLDAALAQRFQHAVAGTLNVWMQQLGRPMWDRSYWPLRFLNNDANETWTDLDRDTGVFVSAADAASGFPEAGMIQLLIEQMARLIIPDATERIESRAPLWVREIFVHWLAQSGLAAALTARSVHAYNESYRIGHWTCYQQFNCAQVGAIRAFYANERNQALAQWREFYDGTLAQQKTLMALQDLLSIVGNAGLRQLFGDFYNYQPNGDELLRILNFQNPERSSELASWAIRWGTAPSATMLDPSQVLPLFSRGTGTKLYPVQATYLTNFHDATTAAAYEQALQ